MSSRPRSWTSWRASRVPRAGLSGPVVVAEAARLADEEGLEALTLAALAGRFGVAVPSLYKHIDGLDGLRRSLAISGLRELGATLEGTTGLRPLAHGYREWARAHPGRYMLSLRAAPADDAEHAAVAGEVLAIVNGVLAEHGLAGEAAIDGARLLRSTLHGFVSLEAAGGFGLPRDIECSFERLLDALEAGLGALGADAPDARHHRDPEQSSRQDPGRPSGQA